MITKRVRSGDVDLAVYEQGKPNAPTVVLVHGYPDTHTVWDGVAEVLEKRFHVVRYDVRGAGQSGRPRARSEYSLSMLANDLRAVIDATAAGQRVHVVGHDWGAIQAWEAVTDPAHAEVIASYSAFSGPCLDHVGHALRASFADPAHLGQAIKSWYIYLFHVPFVAESLWRGGVGKHWAKVLRWIEGVPDARNEPTQTEDGVDGVNLYRANIFPRLLAPRERRAHMPVQIIAPRDDHFVDVSLAETARPWVDELYVRSVEGKHWIVRSEPAKAARWIEELVASVEAGKSPPGLRRASETKPNGHSDKTAGRLFVITGGASGIGRATALLAAERGARVVVVDVDREGVERTAHLCRLLGSQSKSYVCDVSDARAVSALAETVEREHGVPDVLVNNAGVGLAGRFLDTRREDWDRVMSINVGGVENGCREFGARMVSRGEGGHIVNLASAAAFTPHTALPVYATSKAAVLMLSQCLRGELAPHGIGVTAVCPGVIDTPITMSTQFAGATEEEQARRRARAAKMYRRRNVGPKVVAQAILQAVDDNTAVVPVTLEAHLAQAIHHAAPVLSRALGRIDPS